MISILPFLVVLEFQLLTRAPENSETKGKPLIGFYAWILSDHYEQDGLSCQADDPNKQQILGPVLTMKEYNQIIYLFTSSTLN